MKLKKRGVSLRFLYTLDALIGTILIACLAIFASAMLYGSSIKFVLPLLFVAIVLAVAHRFGTITGVLGTVIAAVIFAACLFSPYGNLHVANPKARESLNWMLLGGISLSFLFPGKHPLPERTRGRHAR